MSLSERGSRRVRALRPVRDPDARTVASERRGPAWRSGPAWPSERAWRLEQVTPQAEARQDVHQEAARRGGRSAACPACCPERALPSALGLLSEQARRLEPALPWAQAQAVPKGPLQEAAEASVRAAAERRRAAV